MSREEEAELIVEAEKAVARLAASVRKSKALVDYYRAKLAGQDGGEKPLFRFGEKREG